MMYLIVKMMYLIVKMLYCSKITHQCNISRRLVAENCIILHRENETTVMRCGNSHDKCN